MSDANKLSDIPRTASNPPSQKVSQETLQRILSNDSISLYGLANGYAFEVEKTQTTVTTKVPSQKTSDQGSSTVTLSQEDPQSPPRSNSPLCDTLDWGLFSKI